QLVHRTPRMLGRRPARALSRHELASAAISPTSRPGTPDRLPQTNSDLRKRRSDLASAATLCRCGSPANGALTRCSRRAPTVRDTGPGRRAAATEARPAGLSMEERDGIASSAERSAGILLASGPGGAQRVWAAEVTLQWPPAAPAEEADESGPRPPGPD